MNIAIILAGGIGSRFGDSVPKQYIRVRNKPIIVYTLEKFQNFQSVDEILVVCREEYHNYMNDIKVEYGINKLRWIVNAGETCHDSMMNGIFFLRDICKDTDIIIFHMSVSPLVSEVTVENAVEICKKKGNAFAVQPCLFCMCKKMNNTWSNKNAFKEDYIQLNMPWVIKFGEVYDLYKNFVTSIEEHGKIYLPPLMFKAGKKVYFVQDNDLNKLKITTKGDLDLFEAYLILLDHCKGDEHNG